MKNRRRARREAEKRAEKKRAEAYALARETVSVLEEEKADWRFLAAVGWYLMFFLAFCLMVLGTILAEVV